VVTASTHDLERLSLEEKDSLLSGRDKWSLRGGWSLLPGPHTIAVGSSSRDLRLKACL
jgi:hypothetical protein